ncbi:hypothetical protein ACIBG8_22650 [Nonomuraea sp. NPDC050556]|uniref:hypothetical protein n=1 Tax=Nonomuraea sp. NPDC050556 TaxID=3364369 RepID=UPI0037B551B0
MLHRRQPRHAPSKLDSRNIRLGLSASGTAVLLSVFALTRSERGIQLLGDAMRFLDFYLGVFALVCLTVTVAAGLIATERVFLSPPNRVRAQFAHRMAAASAMVFLAGHLALKFSKGSALGTAATALLAVVVVTGFLRGRFAGTARPWLWRVLHGAAYLAWPVAILHGLSAGRAPAGWVAWSYVACLAAVGSALMVRMAATLLRPPAVPEPVEAPEVAAAPAEAAPDLVQPISLADYRRAG